MRHAAGTTLLELIISVSILSILSFIAIPSFNELLNNQKNRSASLSLLRALNTARAEAIYQSRAVSLWNIDGDWRGRIEMFLDSDRNGIRGEDEELLKVLEGDDQLNISGNRFVARAVTYYPDGSAHNASGSFQAGTIRICRSGEQGVARLILSIGGRLRREWTGSEEC